MLTPVGEQDLDFPRADLVLSAAPKRKELTMILEPLSMGLVLGIGIYYRSPARFLSAVIVVTLFAVLNILGNTHIWRDRSLMVLASP